MNLFKDAEMKLMEMSKERRNNKNITYIASLEETLKINKPSNMENINLDMNETMMLHPTCYPRDFLEINYKICSTEHASLSSRNY